MQAGGQAGWRRGGVEGVGEFVRVLLEVVEFVLARGVLHVAPAGRGKDGVVVGRERVVGHYEVAFVEQSRPPGGGGRRREERRDGPAIDVLRRRGTSPRSIGGCEV